MNCTICGREVTVDFRAKLRRCSGCERGPRFCTCSPAQTPVRWLALAQARPHGLARDLSGRLSA